MTDSDPPVFFLDRALGSHYVAEALQTAGAIVEIFEPHFPPDTPDTVWLPEVSQRGWFILTKDEDWTKSLGADCDRSISSESVHSGDRKSDWTGNG